MREAIVKMDRRGFSAGSTSRKGIFNYKDSGIKNSEN